MGFDSLPDQLVNKCVNKGFDFNILCIGKWRVSSQEKGNYDFFIFGLGETGCGKSTLMDSLFKADFNGGCVPIAQPIGRALWNALLHL